MKPNLPPKKAIECIESSNRSEESQKVPQAPYKEISISQFFRQDEAQQNQRRVLGSIKQNDFAKMVKKRRKNVWNDSENQNLIRFHDQLGNKWSAISKRFLNKTENDVKNRFFSQLRMGLRHLNKTATQLMGKIFQQIKPSVLYKIISSCEEESNRQTQKSLSIKQLSIQLKKDIFDFLLKNQIKKPSQVYELVEKIRLFIALIYPHIKTNKQRIESSFNIISHSQQKEDDQESFLEQTKKEYLRSKIKQMKTMQQSYNEPNFKELTLQHIQSEQIDKLIQKPSICLKNPFEQLSIQLPDQDNSWNIDQYNDQSSLMAMCYQGLIFSNKQSLL